MITRCPNCSYILILLEKRRKYKCAKCGRLYLQKFIGDREFNRWNKKQKELDLEKYGYERRKELAELKELKKSIKLLFNPPKRILREKKPKLGPEERKERILLKKRLRYAKPCYQIKRKEWEKTNKHKRRFYTEKYRKTKRYEIKLNRRLGFWRNQQKELAIQLLCQNNSEDLNIS